VRRIVRMHFLSVNRADEVFSENVFGRSPWVSLAWRMGCLWAIGIGRQRGGPGQRICMIRQRKWSGGAGWSEVLCPGGLAMAAEAENAIRPVPASMRIVRCFMANSLYGLS